MNDMLTPYTGKLISNQQKGSYKINEWLQQVVLGSNAMLAIMNGVIGDILAAAEHPLAISMHFRLIGQSLPVERSENLYHLG